MSTFTVGALTDAGYATTDTVTPGFINPLDFYNFTLANQAEVTINVNGITGGDADVYLFQDLRPVGASTNGGNADEAISSILDPGDYTVSIVPFYGNINYSLDINATFPEAPITDYSTWGMSNSYSLGILDPGTVITTDALPEHSLSLNVKSLDELDEYSFTINTPSTVTIDLTQDANSNVVLEVHDSNDIWVTSNYWEANGSAGIPGSVTVDLVPGTYSVQTILYGTGNTNGRGTYDLTLSAVDNTPFKAAVTAFTGDAIALGDAMVSNDGSVTIIAANYAGDNRQAASVDNFAGEQNSGILISTGNAVSILGQTYNHFAGADTSDVETVKNWANSGGPGATGRAYMQKGNLGSFGLDAAKNDASNPGAADVFTAISALATSQGLDPVKSVYDTASLSFDITTTSNAINFDLIFASEEFPFFANKYVDGATIMVDGVNYAMFDLSDPQTLLSVTQSNVDVGYFNANSQYNAAGAIITSPQSDVTSSAYATEFNGISDRISILAPLDTTKTTHNITISIADTNDHVLDSGLFMSDLHGVEIYVPEEDVGRDGLFGMMRNIGEETNEADVTVGSQTNDYNESGDGDDITDGGEGRDVLFGDAGEDNVEGGVGDDYIDGGTDNDVLVGDVSDDATAEGGNDTLIGGGGDDNVDGGDGRDNLFGDEGNDSLDGGVGEDSIDGGTGDDTIIIELTDTLADSISGGEGNDDITAGASDDTIDGGTGNDSVDAGLGDDTVLAGVGNDSMDGGEGADSMSGGTGRDTLFGGEGDDVISGGTDKLADDLSGGDGNDQITASTGSDTLSGDDGDDTVSSGGGNDDVDGGIGDDIVNGGAGNDVVDAGEGDDTIVGANGRDSLFGSDGTDSLSGGTGADTVDGGAGDDYINLGANDHASDTIIINEDSGDDVCYGFNAVGQQQDIIDVPDPDVLDFTQVTGGWEVQININVSITFMGIYTELLLLDNFI